MALQCTRTVVFHVVIIFCVSVESRVQLSGVVWPYAGPGQLYMSMSEI